jgi:hypothetical protein
LIDPAVLFSGVLAAECAGYASTYAPPAVSLWYLNLEVSSLVQMNRATLAEFCNLPFARVLILEGPMAGFGIVGLRLKKSLCLALSSDLGLVFAAFLARSWHVLSGFGHIAAASLPSVHVRGGGALYLFAILVLAFFVSFTASHLLYFRALHWDA